MIVAGGLHALCAVAFDWEDTLSGGFQSQFYFLILFSIVTIWGLAAHPPASGKGWVGVGAAVASWFSIASGPLATAAVAGWMIVRLFRGAGPRRPNWFTLLAGLMALFAPGVLVNLGCIAVLTRDGRRSPCKRMWR